ncbi:MAG: hypothetical protein ACRDTE_27780, partial [Pseudonocardiaceae bacterium]
MGTYRSWREDGQPGGIVQGQPQLATAADFLVSCLQRLRRSETVGGGRENGCVTTVEQDRELARIDGLLDVLRDAEAE